MRTTSDAVSRDDPFAPLELPAAYEAVADRLRRAIHLGTFAPGERLPPERELAGRFGVSRVTLREALRVLQGEGYIVTRRGSHGGPEVAVPPERLRAALRDRLAEFEELLAFRAVIESGAARMAAANRTDADLVVLEATLDELRAAPDAAAFRRADTRFHLALARASRNDLLERTIQDARELMFGPIDALPFTVMLEKTATEHAAVLAAVRAGRPEPAARRMAEHLASARSQLLDVLG